LAEQGVPSSLSQGNMDQWQAEMLDNLQGLDVRFNNERNPESFFGKNCIVIDDD
jgi:hypothetical protein